MTAIQIIIGLVLLFAGRKLFWLALGVVGFLIGMKLASVFFDSNSELTLIIIAAGAGLLFAVITVLLQKIAIVLAGFVAGGYGAFVLMHRLHVTFGDLDWLPELIAGVLGALFASFVFEWALIILSSAVGSYLIIGSFNMNPDTGQFLFILLSIFGIAVQAKTRKKSKPEKHAETKQEKPE